MWIVDAMDCSAFLDDAILSGGVEGREPYLKIYCIAMGDDPLELHTWTLGAYRSYLYDRFTGEHRCRLNRSADVSFGEYASVQFGIAFDSADEGEDDVYRQNAQIFWYPRMKIQRRGGEVYERENDDVLVREDDEQRSRESFPALVRFFCANAYVPVHGTPWN